MRVKRGPRRARRRKEILEQAKGYFGKKSTSHKMAKEAVEKGLVYAYRDRRHKKREMRSLWTTRINAAARTHGLSYSKLMGGIKLAGIAIDRKILADLAMNDNAAFGKVVEAARKFLPKTA
jgi:large subunit ribosomal protein L20